MSVGIFNIGAIRLTADSYFIAHTEPSFNILNLLNRRDIA